MFYSRPPIEPLGWDLTDWPRPEGSRSFDAFTSDQRPVHIRFSGGGTAYVSASLAMPFVSRFAVYGSRGWIDIRDKAHVEAPAGWVVTAAMAGGPITVSEVPPAEPVKDNLVAFARAIRGEALYPITGEDLVNNITILEATIKSAASDGAVVKVLN